MTDNRYDLESLLDEIRKKKAELGQPVVNAKTPETAEKEDTQPEAAAPNSESRSAAGDGIFSFSPAPAAVETAAAPAAEEKKDDAGWTPISVEELLGTESENETVCSASVNEEAPVQEHSEQESVRDLRSISRQLTGSFDAIPNDYTGDFVIGHPENKREEEPEEEIDFSRDGAEEHPVFTEKTATFNIIPQIDDDRKETGSDEPTDEYTRGELRLDEETKASITQGILNIKESMDDNFRELFGDTVIVEHGDTKKRGRRRDRNVELDYVDLDEVGTDREEDPDAIFEMLSHRASRSIISTVFTAVVSVVIIAFAYITALKGTGNDRVSSIVTAVCMLIGIILNWKTVFAGIAGIFTFKPQLTSLVGFSSIVSMAEPVVSIITNTYPERSYSACISSFALFMSVLGEMLKATRDLKSFRSVSENPQKYASEVVTDKPFVQMLSNDLSDKSTGVLINRRTGYTDRFAYYCDSDNVDFNKTRKAEPFIALACILLGVISFFAKGLSFADSFRVCALSAAISAPFMSFLMFEFPIHVLQNRLNRLGAVLPGYAAAEDIAGANSVVLEGRELFPREKVLLHGIKTFEKERIDQAILYAASVLIHSCDTMSHMFMKVIQGKTDMLFDTDSVVYEEGLGFSFWVDQNRILVGRREMLESHDIEVPSRDYENRYTKASTRDAIYLAVAGKLYAMFVIGYSPDEDMTKLLRGLVKNDISIIVRTRDFIISPEKISRMYDIPQSMITMVRDSSMQELAKRTEYTRHSASSLTHVGSVGAFLSGMIGCNDLIGTTGLSSIMGLVGMCVGIVLAAVLALFGGLDTVKITSVALFQIIWSIIHLVSVLIMR